MRERDDDPRDVLRSIAYGQDDRISPSDRVRAIEQLAEYERLDQARSAIEQLSDEQVAAELRSLAEAVPGMVAVAAGVDAVEPPEDDESLREVIEIQQALIDLLEARLAERERALQNVTAQRRLPAAAAPVVS